MKSDPPSGPAGVFLRGIGVQWPDTGLRSCVWNEVSLGNAFHLNPSLWRVNLKGSLAHPHAPDDPDQSAELWSHPTELTGLLALFLTIFSLHGEGGEERLFLTSAFSLNSFGL